MTTPRRAIPRPESTSTPANPFAASAIGVLYQRGRPYHHPRSLARLRALLGADANVERALDVACGTGMSTNALADFAGSVVGLDMSPEMMRVAPGVPHLSYVLGRAELLPFPAGVFDAVTCSSGVHWFDQDRFFGELRRVVRPNGWIGLYDHYAIGMHDVDDFSAWAGELFERFPLPPRNAQVGAPRTQAPTGFELVGADAFEDPIEMTREQFADFQITVSNCVAVVEQGTPRADVYNWLLDSTEPLFGGATRAVPFVGFVNCLRRLP